MLRCLEADVRAYDGEEGRRELSAAHAGKALVVGGVAALIHWLGTDVAALGTMVAPYDPLHEMLEKMSGAGSETPAPGPNSDADRSADTDDVPLRSVAKSLKPKPKARKPRKT